MSAPEVRQMAEHFAAKHPVKAARAITRMEAARARLALKAERTEAEQREMERLANLEAGYRDGMRGKWCLRCGRRLRDTTQPGYVEGYGPECYQQAG